MRYREYSFESHKISEVFYLPDSFLLKMVSLHADSTRDKSDYSKSCFRNSAIEQLILSLVSTR